MLSWTAYFTLWRWGLFNSDSNTVIHKTIEIFPIFSSVCIDISILRAWHDLYPRLVILWKLWPNENLFLHFSKVFFFISSFCYLLWVHTSKHKATTFSHLGTYLFPMMSKFIFGKNVINDQKEWTRNQQQTVQKNRNIQVRFIFLAHGPKILFLPFFIRQSGLQ